VKKVMKTDARLGAGFYIEYGKGIIYNTIDRELKKLIETDKCILLGRVVINSIFYLRKLINRFYFKVVYR